MDHCRNGQKQSENDTKQVNSVYSGFAFCLGLERMCALMYSLDDIRLMFENDVRFLEQFK